MITLPTKLSGGKYKSTTTTSMRESLRECLQQYKQPVYLEVGAGHGFTIVALSEYYTNAHAVEPDRGRINDLNNLAAANDCTDKITPNQCVFDELEQAHWDVVFIDADHSFEACARDLSSAMRLNTANEFHIVLHDYGLVNGGVRHAVEQFLSKNDNIVDHGKCGQLDCTWNKFGSSSVDDVEGYFIRVKR